MHPFGNFTLFGAGSAAAATAVWGVAVHPADGEAPTPPPLTLHVWASLLWAETRPLVALDCDCLP
jgi:hypothetical protein